MTEQTESVAPVEDNDPIYYKPRSLNLIATLSGIFSWVILVGFVGDLIVQGINIQAQLQGQQVPLSKLITEPAFNSYIFTNMVIPLLMGLGLFLTLQGVSIGLNALLEIDFNIREPKN